MRAIIPVVLGVLLVISISGCINGNGNGDGHTNQSLKAHFIDVGQGDSILIETPGEKFILIDCGDNGYGDDVVDYLEDHGVTEIEYLITTHPHADHIGGCDDVLGNIDVVNVLDNGEDHTSRTYDDYIDLARTRSYMSVSRGFTISVGVVNLAILSPPDPFISSDLNDNSVVVRMTYGSVKMIFTGDCEETCEYDILNSGLGVRSDVLKVGHHGSSTSTSLDFLNAVNPGTAVISVGAGNRYGHPHDITLNNLNDNGVDVYRTDLQGTVVVEATNTGTVSISTER